MNTLRVRVFPGAKEEGVRVGKDGRLIVSVCANAKGGAANKRMRELIARHFGVPPHAVVLLSGHSRPSKTVVIRGT